MQSELFILVVPSNYEICKYFVRSFAEVSFTSFSCGFRCSIGEYTIIVHSGFVHHNHFEVSAKNAGTHKIRPVYSTRIYCINQWQAAGLSHRAYGRPICPNWALLLYICVRNGYESMKGTLRIRIMRTLALNIIFIIMEYNLSSLRFFLLMLFNKMLCNEVEDSYCHNSEDNVLDVSVVFFYFGSKLAFWNDRMKIPTEGS